MTTDDSTRFDGTEEHYAEHRPEYGDAVIRYLMETFGLNGSSHVLDLGCGTGQIAVPLAEHVGEVVAMDPNGAMLQQARWRAENAGLENIEFVLGSDSDVGGDLGAFELTTMGRSFHWMNGKATLESLYGLTEPGGGVTLVTDQEWLTKGTESWQDEVYDVVNEHVDDLPERTGPVESYDDPWDELLADAGFRDVEVETFEFEREWDAEGIIGYVLSLSFCSPEILGKREAAFQSRLTQRLNSMEGETFVQTGVTDVTVGRK